MKVERAVLGGGVLCALVVAWAAIFGSFSLATAFGAVALLVAPFGILVRALAHELRRESMANEEELRDRRNDAA